MKKTVIIGGVAGGASCAARLRRLDEEAEIIMLERGDYISFANCGLPYHVGGAIPDKGDLLLMTPELMKKRFNIDVRVRHEATDIDPLKKTITIKDLSEGKEYEETYDELVIATGSSPIKPKIEGIDSEYIRTVNNVNETALLRQEIKDETVKDVCVIGGGFIGLEMADNLLQAGKKVTIIEAADQLMSPLDKEMSLILNKHLKNKGIEVILNDGVESFKENGKNISVFLKSGRELASDLVILSIGVRPNSELAIKAGLKVNEKAGIVVDEYMRTSLPHIYAAGDVCEVENYVSHEKAMIPLAGPANKQGRLVADNIAGIPRPFKGSQGTSIAKVCDLTAAASGLNEKDLRAEGLKRGTDYETVTISANSHATYYPGARPMMAKLIFDKKTLKILGVQIVGEEGVDKRVDVVATAMRLCAKATDLWELDLAYAPPFGSAKDVVNMLGFTAENVAEGLASFCEYDALEKEKDVICLDVREKGEVERYSIVGSLNIPLGELREHINELDKNRHYIIMCAAGVRAHTASRILQNNGFTDVKIYPGGIRFYRLTH